MVVRLLESRDVGVVWPVVWLAVPGGGTWLVAAGQRHGVRSWDPVAGTAVTVFDVQDCVNALLVCDRPGRDPLLVAGTDYGVEWFDALTGTPAFGPTTRDAVWDLAGATSGDGTATIFGTGYLAPHPIHRWDASTGTVLSDLGEHDDHIIAITTITLSDCTLLVAAAGWGGTIHRWNPATAAPYGPPLIGHDATITSLDTVHMPDGRLLLISADTDGQVRRWDPMTGTPIGQPFTAHPGGGSTTVLAVPTSIGTQLVTSSDDQQLHRWDLMTGVHLGDLGPGYHPVVSHLNGHPTIAAGGSHGLSLYPLPD